MDTGRSRHVGVAMRPIMDLSDGRIVAYRAAPRGGGDVADSQSVINALAIASVTAPAPLLVSLDPSLFADEEFDPVRLAHDASCAQADVIFVMPAPSSHREPGRERTDSADVADAVRQQSARLRSAGYRTALSGVDTLTVVWEDLVRARPTFLMVANEIAPTLADEAQRAALVGLLAFAGQLGARVIAEHVDDASHTEPLMRAGVYYGMGDHVHPWVVLDESLAEPGDLPVSPSWFKERSVRELPGSQPTAQAVSYSALHIRSAVAEDRQLARLLVEWTSTFAEAEEPREVLEILSRVVSQAVIFDRLAIFEADWDRYLLVPQVLIGESLESLTKVSITINTGITGWAFLAGRPYLCSHTSEHPEGVPVPGHPHIDESLIVIPMAVGDRRLGALNLWRDGTHAFNEPDLERADLVARIAAHAWHGALQRSELTRRVVTDTATELLNKRWWQELAPREAAQALRAGSTIAVVVVDLDGFKAVNDSFGHAAGDAALKQVAKILVEAVRSGDAVVRYGGDEFILMLRDCDSAGAIEVAHQVSTALGLTQLQGGMRLSASFGIGFFPEHGTTLEEVAARADSAMYRAKAAGGARISVFTTAASGTLEGGSMTTVAAGSDPTRTTGGSSGQAPGGPVRAAAQLPRHDLEERLRRFRYAEQLARMGSFEMDLATEQIGWSPEFARMLAIPAEAEPSMAEIVNRIHPDDLERYGDAVANWRESGRDSFEMVLGFLTPGGSRKETLLRQVVRPLDDGRRILSGVVQELPATGPATAEVVAEGRGVSASGPDAVETA